MNIDETPPVVADESEGVSDQETTQGEGVVSSEATPPAATTPVTSAHDAKGAPAPTQEDFNRLRSTMDRKLDDMRRSFAARESEYQRQLHEANTRGMTEEQKRQYDYQRLLQENQQMGQYIQQQQAAQASQAQVNGWARWFTQNGVPADKLDTTDGNTVLESGWAYVRSLIGKANGQPPTAPQTPPVAAPAVMTNKGAPVSTKRTWQQVKKKFNAASDEDLLRMYENGEIPANEMPTME